MEPTPEIWSGPGFPPGHPPAQPTLTVELFYDRRSGCSVSFGIPDGAPLLEKYGTLGRALAACRDIVVGDIDVLVREFADEE
jgi:hypothetical protein